MKYVRRDTKKFPNLSGPDQKIKWSAIKHNVSHLKDLDLKDTGHGSSATDNKKQQVRFVSTNEDCETFRTVTC